MSRPVWSIEEMQAAASLVGRLPSAGFDGVDERQAVRNVLDALLKTESDVTVAIVLEQIIKRGLMVPHTDPGSPPWQAFVCLASSVLDLLRARCSTPVRPDPKNRLGFNERVHRLPYGFTTSEPQK